MKYGLMGIALAIALGAGARADEDGQFRLLKLGGEAVRWTAPAGLPAVVTYAFIDKPTRFAGARNCEAMEPIGPLLARNRISPAAFKVEVRAAFAAWSQAADIRFVEVANADAAGIRIGAQQQPEGRAFADVRHGEAIAIHQNFRAIERSLICLNPRRGWKIGFDGDLSVYDLRYTLTHEIGHAIGLDHPAPQGQLMSHRYTEAFRTLQPGDIDGAIQLYGKPTTGSSTANLETRR